MHNFDNLIEIEFIDPSTKEIINSFNLSEGNPYNDLNFPEKLNNSKNPCSRHKQYKIDNVKLKDFNIANVILLKNKSINDSILIKNATLLSYFSYNVYDSIIIIVYNLNLIDQTLLAVSNVFLIFNERGQIVNSIQNINHWCNEFTITDNKEYFACSFGGLDNDSEGYFESLGYLTYNLSEMETQTIEYFNSDYQSIGVRNYGNIIRIGMVKDNNTEDLIYYNFDIGKKYSRNVSDAILFKIKNTNEDGFIYMKNGVFDTMLFEKDFLMEEIK